MRGGCRTGLWSNCRGRWEVYNNMTYLLGIYFHLSSQPWSHMRSVETADLLCSFIYVSMYPKRSIHLTVETLCWSQMNSIMEECEASTDVLQDQVDEAREKSQRELDELRRQLQEKGAELEKSRQAAKKLQEEVWYPLSLWFTSMWVQLSESPITTKSRH